MPTFIVKPDPDENVYVGWSTVTESIAFWGTREEIIEIAVEDAKRKAQELIDSAPAETEKRLDRADGTGTSAFGRIGGFGDHTFMWENRGILRRERMLEMLDTYDEELGDFKGDHLLEPFDED